MNDYKIVRHSDLAQTTIQIYHSLIKSELSLSPLVREVYRVELVGNDVGTCHLKFHIVYSDQKSWVGASLCIDTKSGIFETLGVHQAERNHTISTQTSRWSTPFGDGPAEAAESTINFFFAFLRSLEIEAKYLDQDPQKFRQFFCDSEWKLAYKNHRVEIDQFIREIAPQLLEISKIEKESDRDVPLRRLLNDKESVSFKEINLSLGSKFQTLDDILVSFMEYEVKAKRAKKSS